MASLYSRTAAQANNYVTTQQGIVPQQENSHGEELQNSYQRRLSSRHSWFTYLSLIMSQDLLGVANSQERPNLQAGELNRLEKQWANRQTALEEAGYMLRQRYRPGWQPTWIGTGKFCMDVEDGQAQGVSVDVL